MTFKELEAKLTLDTEEFKEEVQEAKEALRELEEAATDAEAALDRLRERDDAPGAVVLDLSGVSTGEFVSTDELEDRLRERDEKAADELGSI